ncbi:Glycosyltransferase, GT2 family [Rhizobiales bacterium GAS188]|nr:Glycosyltransferase, GT2 family [Rhizobiales bacterium GAS188]
MIAVIVAHDSAAILPSCLAALAREGGKAIVVDNASSDKTAEIAAEAGAQLIHNARNEGYGRAMNIGMRAATSKFCLLLNPDVAIAEGSVGELLRAAQVYPEAGMLAPRLIEPDGRLFFQPRSLLSPYLRNEAGRPCNPEGDCCSPFLSGACLLVERDLVLSLGGFDEEIFLFYEDDDLCRRMIEAGHPLVHVHAALARHERGGSTARRRGSIFAARWHLAWSAGHVARKYKLADPSWRTLIVNALKFCGAALLFDRGRMERYGGSAAGACAWLRGKNALEREGLAREPGA